VPDHDVIVANKRCNMQYFCDLRFAPTSRPPKMGCPLRKQFSYNLRFFCYLSFLRATNQDIWDWALVFFGQPWPWSTPV